MNNINLIGRLTRDAELKFTPGSGMAVTKFSIAVNRMKKGEADFINCVAFGKTGETISQYTAKGNEIGIQGHLQTGSYNNKDGVKVFTSDVIVDRFFFVGNKGSNDNNNGGSFSKNNNSSSDEITPVDDGEMPF